MSFYHNPRSKFDSYKNGAWVNAFFPGQIRGVRRKWRVGTDYDGDDLLAY